MRYYITDEINPLQKEWLINNGFYCYNLRHCEGRVFSIEKGNVIVDNIGVMITDTELKADIDSVEFFDMDVSEIPYSELEPINQWRNTNFHYHIKGKIMEEYFCYRTWCLEEAKKALKRRMEYVHKKDPSARAYRFGTSKDDKAFWKIYFKIREKEVER